MRSLMEQLLEGRILLLDGAMGTMVQTFDLQEADFRGDMFEGHSIDLIGNNEALNITNEGVILDIHRKYLESGSDIIETNTFGATSVSQREYGLERHARQMNISAARIARQAVDEAMEDDPERPRFVAGAVGPTNKTLSSSEDVDDPSFRGISFDELRDSYFEQVEALIEERVDLILIETVFDVLNAKAAIAATLDAFEKSGVKLPIMLSVTFIQEGSDRTVFGQTVDAFWVTVAHAKPFSVGINCGLGAKSMVGNLTELSRLANTHTHCYPNAGLPNPLAPTGFDETPEITSTEIRGLAEKGLVNIVGGCCGTTPDHIRAIAEAEGALQKISRSFSDPSVGAVTGMQILLNTEQSGQTHQEGQYRDFYSRLRIAESTLDSTPIFHGECAAYRRSAIKNHRLVENANADDSQMAVAARRSGYKAIFDSEITFFEMAPPDYRATRIQKVRRAQGLIRHFWRNKDIVMSGSFGHFRKIIALEFCLHIVLPILVLLGFLSGFAHIALVFGNTALELESLVSLPTPEKIMLAADLLVIVLLACGFTGVPFPASKLSLSFLIYTATLVRAQLLILTGTSLHKWEQVPSVREALMEHDMGNR